MKQEMGTGPGLSRSLQTTPSRGLLGEEKLKSHPRSGPCADPSRCLRQPPFPISAGGGRLESADAGLAGVRLKDDVTHLAPRGWYLSANLLRLFSPGRKTPLDWALDWVRGLTATPGPRDWDAATGKRALVSLSGSVTASPTSCVSHSAAGLDAIACKTENTY